MKRSVVVASALAGSLALSFAALAGSPPAAAGAASASNAADKSVDAPAVRAVAKAIATFKCTAAPCGYAVSTQSVLDGFKWGINHVEVAEVYNQPGGLFDKEYDTVLAHMQPGHTMQAVEAERDLLKESVSSAVNFIEFKTSVTGFDATPLRSEYTYRNKESVLVVDRGAWRRYFFFFADPPRERLWKVYEEVPLAVNGTLGKSFEEAVAKLNRALGVAGRVRPADSAKGLDASTADWQDPVTHLRLVQRADSLIGVVLEERATLAALPQLRTHKGDDPFAIDPSVKAITEYGMSDPNAQPPAQPKAGEAPGKKPPKGR